jgi:hypothetical protein
MAFLSSAGDNIHFIEPAVDHTAVEGNRFYRVKGTTITP